MSGNAAAVLRTTLLFALYKFAVILFIFETPLRRCVVAKRAFGNSGTLGSIELISLAVGGVINQAHDQDRWEKHDEDTVTKSLNELRTRAGRGLVTHRATLGEKCRWAKNRHQQSRPL